MTDNILINKFKNENYSVHPLINDLSDHDGQVLSLPDIFIPDYLNEFYTYRNISKYSLEEFQTSLSYEAWEYVFSNNDNDTNTDFNNFLNNFLRKFYATSPKKEQKLCRIPNPG